MKPQNEKILDQKKKKKKKKKKKELQEKISEYVIHSKVTYCFMKLYVCVCVCVCSHIEYWVEMKNVFLLEVTKEIV